jgi:hypothetical protein
MILRLIEAGMNEEKAIGEVARGYHLDVKVLTAAYEKKDLGN